ncbi:hypothetical protein [Desulfolutivibrio sp.]|uniref:hypothetical protein n=1 Tax=Desulfolutivibrio sp. TaxID=2773296 RepID=UPI002F96134C
MKARSWFSTLQQRLQDLPANPQQCTRRNMAACLSELEAIKHDLLDNGYPAQHAAILLSNETLRSNSSQRSSALLALIYKQIGWRINHIKAWLAKEFPELLQKAALAGCELALANDDHDLARERLRFILRHLPLDEILQDRLSSLETHSGAFPFWRRSGEGEAALSPVADAAILPACNAMLSLSAAGEMFRHDPKQGVPVPLRDMAAPGGRFLRGREGLAVYRPTFRELMRITGNGEPGRRDTLPVDADQTLLGGCLTEQGPVVLLTDAHAARPRIMRAEERGLADITPACVSFPCAVATHGGSLIIADAHRPMLFELDAATGETAPMAASWPHGRAIALGSDSAFLYLLSHEHLVCLRRDDAEPVFALELLQLSGGVGKGAAFDCAPCPDCADMVVAMSGPGPLHRLHTLRRTLQETAA